MDFPYTVHRISSSEVQREVTLGDGTKVNGSVPAVIAELVGNHEGLGTVTISVSGADAEALKAFVEGQGVTVSVNGA